MQGFDCTGENGKREYEVREKPSAKAVMFGITAIYDGSCWYNSILVDRLKPVKQSLYDHSTSRYVNMITKQAIVSSSNLQPSGA